MSSRSGPSATRTAKPAARPPIPKGLDRPNLGLAVEVFRDEDTKRRALVFRLSKVRPAGIVFVATRRHAEELAHELDVHGYAVTFDHGGLHPEVRREAQHRFLTGQASIMVATSAFGADLDPPGVRFVFHYDVSESLDAYYREIRRAGRDGRPAEAVLFYRSADLALHRFFAGGGQLDEAQVRQVAEALRSGGAPVHARDLADRLELPLAKLRAAIHGLEEIDAVEVLASGEFVAQRGDVDAAEAARRVMRAREEHQNCELSRIETMRAYAETEQCRRHYLLNYLGEGYDPPCNRCDNCLQGTAVAAAATVEAAPGGRPFAERSFVLHQHWGKGMVARYERNKIVVLFDTTGYKTFLLSAVVKARLLRPMETPP